MAEDKEPLAQMPLTSPNQGKAKLPGWVIEPEMGSPTAYGSWVSGKCSGSS